MSPVRPPMIATGLLRLLTPKSIRSPLLGDLNEGFANRAEHSVSGARRWYWSQALGSAPHLLKARLGTPLLKTVGAALITTLAAAILIQIWDIYVARHVAALTASQGQTSDIGFIRTVYFSVQSLGIAIIGGLIMTLATTRTPNFVMAAWLYLGPVFLLILFINMAIGVARADIGYALFRTALAGLALCLGGYGVYRWRSRK